MCFAKENSQKAIPMKESNKKCKTTLCEYSFVKDLHKILPHGSGEWADIIKGKKSEQTGGQMDEKNPQQ